MAVKADGRDLLWDLFVELRKEIVGTQRIRAQLIGFKISFVSATAGLLLANAARVPREAFVLPAFAAVFFDLLIYSQSFSVKRIGTYCREVLEPELRRRFHIRQDLQLWEEFVSDPQRKQSFLVSGNLGITLLACLVGGVALLGPETSSWSGVLIVILAGFFVLDVTMSWHSRRGRFRGLNHSRPRGHGKEE